MARLLKALIYKSCSFCITVIITYLFLHRLMESVWLALGIELSTFVFYIIYEELWDRRH